MRKKLGRKTGRFGGYCASFHYTKKLPKRHSRSLDRSACSAPRNSLEGLQRKHTSLKPKEGKSRGCLSDSFPPMIKIDFMESNIPSTSGACRPAPWCPFRDTHPLDVLAFHLSPEVNGQLRASGNQPRQKKKVHQSYILS